MTVCYSRAALLIAALLSVAFPAPAQTRYALPQPEQPVALLAVGRTQYLVTVSGVYEVTGRELQPRYRSDSPIACALATDTALCLGTRRGTLSLRPGRWQAHRLALPDAAAEAPVTALLRDAAGALWVGAAGYGTYRGRPSAAWEPVLRVPGVSAGATTPDSAVWLGSNLGLHRYHRSRWTRYNEEGVANFEIPDNLVERLLPDRAGTVWVVMSDAVCALPAGPRPAELPTATFLGSPGNELLAAAYLPGAGRLFATGQGLLLLPTASAAEFGSFEPAPATDAIAPRAVLRPLRLPGLTGAPYLAQLDGRQRLWLADSQGLLLLTSRQWRAAVRAGVGEGMARREGS